MRTETMAPTAARALARQCAAALEARRKAIEVHRANVRAYRDSYDVGKQLWTKHTVKLVIATYTAPEGYQVSGWVDPATGLPPPTWGHAWRERLEETGGAMWEASREYHNLFRKLRAAIISISGAASLRRNVWGGNAL